MLCLFVLIAIPFKSNFCDCMSTQRKFKNMATKYKNIKKYATAFTELFYSIKTVLKIITFIFLFVIDTNTLTKIFH